MRAKLVVLLEPLLAGQQRFERPNDPVAKPKKKKVNGKVQREPSPIYL
jgi:hypothetical protein